MKKLALCVTLGQRPEICPFSLANETSSCCPLLPLSQDARQERQATPTKPAMLQTQWQGEAGFLAEKRLCVQFHSIIPLPATIGVPHCTILAAESQLSTLLLLLLLLSDVSKASEIRTMRVGGWKLGDDQPYLIGRTWTSNLLQVSGWLWHCGTWTTDQVV